MSLNDWTPVLKFASNQPDLSEGAILQELRRVTRDGREESMLSPCLKAFLVSHGYSKALAYAEAVCEPYDEYIGLLNEVFVNSPKSVQYFCDARERSERDDQDDDFLGGCGVPSPEPDGDEPDDGQGADDLSSELGDDSPDDGYAEQGDQEQPLRNELLSSSHSALSDRVDTVEIRTGTSILDVLTTKETSVILQAKSEGGEYLWRGKIEHGRLLPDFYKDVFAENNDVRSTVQMSLNRVDYVLDEATWQSFEAMFEFSQQEDAAAQMAVAFGDGYDVAAADQFFDALVMGPGVLPRVEVLDDSILGGALGAYAQATDTVYMSRQFLESGTVDAITGDLIEEFGNAIDARVNAIDAAGDEGEIFSAIVARKEVSFPLIEVAQLSNDRSSIRINGEDVLVEFSRTVDADFDRDGTSDILWQRELDGMVALWHMNNGKSASSSHVETVPGGWELKGSADFNGDGTSDILWQRESDGMVALWHMNDGKSASSSHVETVPGGWELKGSADFDGDGTSDILWQRELDGIIGHSDLLLYFSSKSSSERNNDEFHDLFFSRRANKPELQVYKSSSTSLDAWDNRNWVAGAYSNDVSLSNIHELNSPNSGDNCVVVPDFPGGICLRLEPSNNNYSNVINRLPSGTKVNAVGYVYGDTYIGPECVTKNLWLKLDDGNWVAGAYIDGVDLTQLTNLTLSPINSTEERLLTRDQNPPRENGWGVLQSANSNYSHVGDSMHPIDIDWSDLNMGKPIYLVDGFQADKAATAASIPIGQQVMYSFEVENTGDVPFNQADITISDPNVDVFFAPASDVGNDGVLSPGEKWYYYSISQTAPTTKRVIDFETDALGNALLPGTVIDDEYQAFGVTIKTFAPYQEGTVIFDTANPTSDDDDLGTPNVDFGSPSVGVDSWTGIPGKNSQPLGNVLVLSELNRDPDDPNDSSLGGMFRFNADRLLAWDQMNFQDIENDKSWIKFHREGVLVGSQDLLNLDDNSYQEVDFGGVIADRIDVFFLGSGSLSGLEFQDFYCENTATVNMDFPEFIALESKFQAVGALPNRDSYSHANQEIWPHITYNNTVAGSPPTSSALFWNYP